MLGPTANHFTISGHRLIAGNVPFFAFPDIDPAAKPEMSNDLFPDGPGLRPAATAHTGVVDL